MSLRNVVRVALVSLLVGAFTVSLSACGSNSTLAVKPSGSSGVPAEPAEEVVQTKEEAAELAKNREVLSVIESKKREEAADAQATQTLAVARARAKHREQKAAAEVKKKEELATANLKKREEALTAEARQKASNGSTQGKHATTTTPTTPPTTSVPQQVSE